MVRIGPILVIYGRCYKHSGLSINPGYGYPVHRRSWRHGNAYLWWFKIMW
jgi:hypothetical protein